MKTPTIEDIDRLIQREYPGYRLDVGSRVEVAEGRIKTYVGTKDGAGSSTPDPPVILKP